MQRLIDSVILMFQRLPYAAIGLLARLAMGLTFWNSARTKVDGWNIFAVNDKTLFLFQEEYKLFRWLGKTEIYIAPPWLMALAAQVAEHVLGAMLIVGLATRFSALGLLVMTLVIEFFVYPGAYVLHGLWAALLLTIMKYGPGKLSLDEFISRR